MTIDFSAKPYFDDYKKEKGFYKILFKPGVSVQARELNQLQEILQQQIARFGTHIFKNGSVVIPGQVRLNRDASYVILENVNNDPDLPNKLIGKTLLQQVDPFSDYLKAVVTLTKPLDSTKILTVVSYLNSTTKTVAGEVQNITTFSSNIPISVENEPTINIAVASQGPNGEPVTGNATFLVVESGVFYVEGYFVYTETQSTLIGWNYDSYNPLNAKAGFVVKKEIVTAYDDPSLFDNATGSPNEGAPGADRFQIILELKTLDLNDENEDFIELVRFENNNLKLLRKYAQYNELEDTLARRTYDESGDYVVHGFDIKVVEHLKSEENPSGYLPKERGGDTNKFAVEVSKGKAYIKGYEIEKPDTFYVEAVKARTLDAVKSKNNVLQVNENGEYIFLAPGNNFIDISRHPIIWLTNGFENTSEIIGCCIPKHVEAFNLSNQVIFKLFGSFYLENNAQYDWRHLGGWKIDDLRNGPVLQRVFLQNVVGNFIVNDANPLTSHPNYTPYAWDESNKILYVKKASAASAFDTNIQVVKGSASGYVSKIEFKKSYSKGPGDLIKLNIPNVRTIKDALGNYELTAEVGFSTTITTNANGYGEYEYLGDGIFVGQPVAASTQHDNAFFSNIVNIDGAGKKLVINNTSYPNTTFSVCASLSKKLEIKTKTLTEGNTIITKPSGNPMVLVHKDVYKLKHVYVSPNLSTAPTSSDPDIVDYFELVNNDTLDFYQNTSLKAKEGFAIPSGQLLVVYDYFLHSPGDVFTVDSYASLKDNPNDDDDMTHIERIPLFSTKDETYVLSDYLDFRQVPRDGFFIIKGVASNGSPDILVEQNYTAVISQGSKVFCHGFPDNTTVSSVSPDKITLSNNASFSNTSAPYNVYLIVNSSSAIAESEPFYPEVKNIWAPKSGQPLIYDIQYFVGRWDRLVCFKDGEVKYLYGIPGVEEYPETPEDAISLAVFIVPPYTRRASFIKYKKDDNRRYTMRDIGKLEKRIENLEYYTTLTLKELETKNLKIPDANGLDRFKSGFFVTDFKDFSVFDPFKGEFSATLVPEQEKVIPLEYSDNIGLKFDQMNSNNYVIKNNQLFLPYTEVVEIEQPYATATETVNPYLIIKWNASLTLNPSNDFWVETEWAPTVTNIRNISRTIVNERTELASVRTITAFTRDRRNVGTTVSDDVSVSETTTTNVSTVKLGSHTEHLRTSIIPFIRPRIIRFDLKGSKPNTRYWPSFDSEDVSSLCRPVNILTGVVGTWGSPLISDSMGNLSGDFSIPPGRFTIGSKTFKLTDVNIIEHPEAGVECEASATYNALGIQRTMREVIEMARITTITVNRVVSVNRTITNTVFRSPRNSDPLAQSFMTTNIDGPGMFITKIALYFHKKDPLLPVFLELREMINGYPAENRIPGSLVVLEPNQVNVSEDSTVPTYFVFDKPIWLESKKSYCFVVAANTSRYHVWISRLGEKVVNENKIIGEQPSLGSLFKSQNASTWTPFQLEDMKFKIYRAKFNTNVIGTWSFENDGLAAKRRVFVNKFYSEQGSTFLTVYHPNHGMRVNEKVKIEAETAFSDIHRSPSASTIYNGISMSEIYGIKIVKEIVDINHYKIEVTTPATKTGYFEDVDHYVYIHSNINFYTYNLACIDAVLPETELRYYSNLITGKDFDGGQTPKVPMFEQEIKNGELNYLQQVGLVQIAENETSKSVKIVAKAKTNNEYVSPILSLKNASINVFSLALNKPDLTNDNENDPRFEKGKVNSKIITQKIRLKTPANSLRILTSENKQHLDDIEVYYRVTINRDLEEKSWTKIEPSKNIVSYDTSSYIEIERQVEGLPDFDEFQIKIVFKGTDSTKYPSLKELRAIAVAD